MNGIGIDITELRKRLGWSLDDMGRYFGVSAAAVSKWESGKGKPDPVNIAILYQLWDLTEKRLREEARRQLGERLKIALITGGIAAGLMFLFTSLADEEPSEEEYDENEEPLE